MPEPRRCPGCAAPISPNAMHCRGCAVFAVVREPPAAVHEPEPTAARPGTAEKVLELTRRLWAGQRLWCRKDAGMGREG